MNRYGQVVTLLECNSSWECDSKCHLPIQSPTAAAYKKVAIVQATPVEWVNQK